MPALDEYSQLPLSELVRSLNDVGSETVTIEMIKADIAAGAPTNRDGTINLIDYTAWLAAQRIGKRP
ncbi:MAG: hypothetical protein PVJ57_17525 [Phycisphaerae bacterium]|jgi:hypothetical protein